MNNAIEKCDTTVVVVGSYTFNYLKSELEYSFPISRNRKLFEYLAFYRPKPISAITHYGKIEDVITEAEIPGKYRLMAFEDEADVEGVKVQIRDLERLTSPVKASKGKGGAIQGFYYTMLEYIKKANNILELRSFRKD